MKKNIFIFLSMLLLVFALTSSCALAWTYGQRLVPCTTDCQLCELWQLAKNIIDFILIAVVPIVGTLMFILAGIYYLLGGANPGFVSKAKNLFTNTIYAIAIMMLAWLIVNTLIVNLGSNGIHAWYQLNCTEPDFGSAFQPIPGFPQPPPAAQPLPTPNVPPGIIGRFTDAEARSMLAAVGISVNAPQPQTSLENMRTGTIGEVMWLKSQCGGCTIVVTGGTEPGHSSNHTNGYKVDLRLDPVLHAYITTQFQLFATVPYPQYRSPTGAVYMLEPDHWDVCVGAPSCP